MDNIINCLYNFSTSLTYDLLDTGCIESKLYINEYCNHYNIDDSNKEMITDYYNFHTKNIQGWFPEFQEVSEWYDYYKKLKNI